ncbi:MAG: hypothetical protein ACK2UA_11905, partial [Anaerolineae bacterium]
ALEAVVSMAALYIHYARQSAFVIDTLETRIAEIERRGEDSYNRSMIAGLRSEGPTPQPA